MTFLLFFEFAHLIVVYRRQPLETPWLPVVLFLMKHLNIPPRKAGDESWVHEPNLFGNHPPYFISLSRDPYYECLLAEDKMKPPKMG